LILRPLTKLRASGDAVHAGTAGRDGRAYRISIVVRRHNIAEQFATYIAASLPLKPMMRRSGIDLGENHDLGRPATEG